MMRATQARAKILGIGEDAKAEQTQICVKILCERTIPSRKTQLRIKFLVANIRPGFDVWWHCPIDPFTEVLEWKTDLIETRASEQRIALRQFPRQYFSVKAMASDALNEDLRSVGQTWLPRAMSVPVWSKFITMPIQAGSTIYFDTEGFEFSIGRRIIIFDVDNPSDFEQSEISAVYADRVELLTPVQGRNMAHLLALRTSLPIEGFGFTKAPADANSVEAKFETPNPIAVSGSPNLPQIDSAYIFDWCPIATNGVQESIGKLTEKFDGGTGSVYYGVKQDWESHRFSGEFMFEENEVLNFKRFLYWAKGKQKSFYIPTLGDDFQAKSGATSGADTINVRAPIRLGALNNARLMIELKNGSRYYFAVTQILSLSGETATISVTPSFAENISLSDIKYICSLVPVRMDNDSIEIQYHPLRRATVSLQFLRVPDELFSN